MLRHYTRAPAAWVFLDTKTLLLLVSMSEDDASPQSASESEELCERFSQNSLQPEVEQEVLLDPVVSPQETQDDTPGPKEEEDGEEQNKDEGDKEEVDADFDDDDFGSFDEASFEEFQAPDASSATNIKALSLDDLDTVDEELQKLIDQIFPDCAQNEIPEPLPLISETLTLFSVLSRNPRLNPPNWIKLNIRHSLLVKLGVPINLDELESSSVLSSGHTRAHSRRRSIDVNDIGWENFEIPEFSTLDISPEKKEELVRGTHDELSRIEAEIMNNTSELFLQSAPHELVEAKLAQMKQNYAQLIQLGSVWQDQIHELKNSQEIYESVVQSMVGYSQKLQRNEILESLKSAKTKKGKRTF